MLLAEKGVEYPVMKEELKRKFPDYHVVEVERLVSSMDASVEGLVDEEKLRIDIWKGINQFTERKQPPKLLVDFSGIPSDFVIKTEIIDILGYYLDDIQKENGSGVLLGLDRTAREAFELIGLTEGKKNPNGYKAA